MPEKSQYISLDQAERPLVAGIDVGGTNIKVGLVDAAGGTLAFDNIPTEVPQGPDAAIRRMAQKVADLIDQVGADRGDLARAGLATPGTMDIPNGLLLHPHNLPGFENYPVRDRLAAACGAPVSYNNDANAAAYGEYWVGRGRDYTSMVLLTLGTGVGGGIIIHGEVIDGHHSHGAECGHLIIDYHDDARVCPCGKPGHLEAYASATGVVARTQDALSGGAESSLNGLVQSGEELSSKAVYEHARDGDAFALDVVLETAMYLGVGITSFLHVIDPEAVVLGGAMDFGGPGDPIGDRFLARIREEVDRRAFPVLAERTVIDFASLGGDAGYLGAAGIALKEHNKPA